MEVAIRKKKFIAVEYPGVVQNEKKMLTTLGGEKNINQVFNTPGQRLELRYRPDDVYCKPACANKHVTTSLVLKVRRKKKLLPPGEQTTTGSVQFEYEAEILGIIDGIYSFKNLVDFQYLPMMRKGTSGSNYTSLYDDLCLDKIKPVSWTKNKVPLYLPPTIFSRIDNPSEYNYRDGPYKSTPDTSTAENPNIIAVSRQRRPHFTRIVMWENWEVPTEPNPQALRKIYKKNSVPTVIERLKQLFEERPIWSRTALMMNLGQPRDNVKVILPSIAYYILTGPWRRVWVRFGYDPRTDPAAKLYQVVDFRIKDKSLSSKLGINIKRSSTSYRLPNKMTKSQAVTPKIKRNELRTGALSTMIEAETQAQRDSYYKFYPGLVPAYHQICYQYCDLLEPEIQRLISRNDGQATVCTEKDGWCLPNTTEDIRRIIVHHLYNLAKEKDKAKGVLSTDYGKYSTTTVTTNQNEPLAGPSSSLAGGSTNQDADDDDLADYEELNSEEEELLGGALTEEEEEGEDIEDG